MSGSKTRPPIPDDPYVPIPTGKQILFVQPTPAAVSMEYLWNTVLRHNGVILERFGQRVELTVGLGGPVYAQDLYDPNVIEAAKEKFAEYFRANYPGPDTIITEPDWHAPKIFRAAIHALEAAAKGTGQPSSKPPEKPVRRLFGTSWTTVGEDKEWRLVGDSSGHIFATVYPLGRSFVARFEGLEGLIRPTLEDAKYAADQVVWAMVNDPNFRPNTDSLNEKTEEPKSLVSQKLPLLESNQDSPDPEAGAKVDRAG